MAWALKLPLTDEVIESGLVQDFDASLSGIGQELGAGAYSMRYVVNLGQNKASMLFFLIIIIIIFGRFMFLYMPHLLLEIVHLRI